MGSDYRIGVDAQKKTVFAKERESDRVQALRKEFVAKFPALSSNRLIFLDESGFRLGATNLYGWGPKGQKVFGYASHASWKTMTMIGAMSVDGLHGFMTIDAATSGDVFLAFVEQQLVPNIREGDVIIMDNLAAHKNSSAREAIERCGAIIEFLPPYSPDLNPIEKLWAKVKEWIRRCDTTTRALFDNALAEALDNVTHKDRIGWTQYSGYTVN